MTETEAKQKWCPMARRVFEGATFNRDESGGIADTCLCVGARCMMWRWVMVDNGRCGLAGLGAVP